MGHGHPWGERRCHLSRPAGQTDGSGRGRGRYFSSLGLTTCSALLVRLNLARVSSSPDPPAASPPSLSPSIVPSHSVTDAFLPPCFPAVSAASPPLSLSLWFAPFSLGGPLPLSSSRSSPNSIACCRASFLQPLSRSWITRPQLFYPERTRTRLFLLLPASLVSHHLGVVCL